MIEMFYVESIHSVVFNIGANYVVSIYQINAKAKIII